MILEHLLLLLVSTVAAKCGCGYTVNATDSGQYELFTDLFETDFLHVKDSFNAFDVVGWQTQNYNAGPSRGPFGMASQITNLVPNYIDSPYNYFGPGIRGPDPGLQLFVRSGFVSFNGSQLVPVAEIASERDDILYGSFRVAMKTTAVSGTCGTFFFYQSDSQEIDLEILSANPPNEQNQFPAHFVVQNPGTTASNILPPNQLEYNMTAPPGGPSDNYNEYRFDWMPDRIDYYVNGVFAWTVTEGIPNTAGRIHIKHWSNGNPQWTAGPPVSDAVLSVSYLKAYFNSTNSTRKVKYDSVCPDNSPQALQQTCVIPDQKEPPNPSGARGNITGHTFFFMHQKNETPNQTTYHSPSERASGDHARAMNLVLILIVLVVFSYIVL